MAVCLIVDSNNNATISNASIESCTGYLIPDSSEYSSFLNPSLEINQSLFISVTTALLVSFITGHVTGRIVRYLGKR